ncbi:bifunctional riboflavin kinase/FAD synthetase [Pseudohongiella sp. O18]|uniref:bifunctional riboflavin kinase/FAD synthetase n=1 Tax=Pseudohongiella sp. O18 TaxID=2904248 RepID=UPI001F2B77D6|nr:bifunctional riboflavin kinase/FAD synthetase [Pseudohongiella sp. O18]
MNVIHDTEGFLEHHPGCVATIGKFDGVHLGHQQIVRQLRARAAELDVPTVVIVIEPHPEEFFARNPRDCPPRLSEAAEKITLLEEFGVDTVYLLRFDDRLCRLSPQQYVEDILIKGLNVRCLIVGNDFRFGHQRQGDYALLQEYGARAGFQVIETQSCSYDGARVSSTYVRDRLRAGDFETVAGLLGRPYAIAGEVVKGRQLGRDIGFPTCNLALNRRNIPLHGVYVCDTQISLPDGRQLSVSGIANIGYRPTVDDSGEAILEVHLLDFDQDVYGAWMSVIFRHRVRSEQKFSSLDELTQQIGKDTQQARAWLANH